MAEPIGSEQQAPEPSADVIGKQQTSNELTTEDLLGGIISRKSSITHSLQRLRINKRALSINDSLIKDSTVVRGPEKDDMLDEIDIQ